MECSFSLITDGEVSVEGKRESLGLNPMEVNRMELPIVKKLREELKYVEHELKVEIPKALQAAVALGDISDSGDYQSAKERQRLLEARGNQLKERLLELTRIKIENLPKDAIGFGSFVELENERTGQKVTYTIWIPDDAGGDKNIISFKTPLAQALIGLREDDEIALTTIPAGKGPWFVRSFRTLHDRLAEMEG